jgi:GR25 family glycosyltransferase involved in LPS biosynthesis
MKVPIFVINLDRSVDRWDFLKDDFQKRNLDLIRVSAIDGKKDLDGIDPSVVTMQTLFDLKNNSAPHDHRFLSTANAVACVLSHHKVYDIIINNEIPIACVLEDDTCFMPGKTLEDFNDVMRSVDGKSDVYLLRYEAMHGLKNKKNKGSIFFEVKFPFMNIGSYLITLEGAKKLKSLSFPISMHYDMFIGLCANLGKLKVMALEKDRLFLQDRKLDSTLGHSKNMFSFLDKKRNHPSEFVWDEEKQICLKKRRMNFGKLFFFLFLTFLLLSLILIVLLLVNRKKCI